MNDLFGPLPATVPIAEGWPDDAFDQFWELYPRREAKGAARKAFGKIQKAGKVPLAKILRGAHEYAERIRKSGTRFVVHPSTWLNQERWDDEEYEKANGFWGAYGALK